MGTRVLEEGKYLNFFTAKYPNGYNHSDPDATFIFKSVELYKGFKFSDLADLDENEHSILVTKNRNKNEEWHADVTVSVVKMSQKEKDFQASRKAKAAAYNAGRAPAPKADLPF